MRAKKKQQNRLIPFDYYGIRFVSEVEACYIFKTFEAAMKHISRDVFLSGYSVYEVRRDKLRTFIYPGKTCGTRPTQKHVCWLAVPPIRPKSIINL